MFLQNRLLNIKARAPSYNNTPSQGHDSSTRTLLKTTNAHACQGVSFVASVIRVLLLSCFKMDAKNYWPNIFNRTNFWTQRYKKIGKRIETSADFMIY